MLYNPLLVPYLCRLNHISVCFNQISTKSPANSLFSLQGRQCFFWSHLRCFGPLCKFQHNIKISIKMTRVSRLSVFYDYGLIQKKSSRKIDTDRRKSFPNSPRKINYNDNSKIDIEINKDTNLIVQNEVSFKYS